MKKLEHFNFLLVQSQQQQLRNFNPSKSFYLQMIPNAIACYQNLLLTQRSIGQRNVQVGALRSRLAPDFSSFYYFTPEFFEEGRREERPPSSLKISTTPTTKPCPYTMPPHVLLVTDFKTFPKASDRQVKHTNAVEIRYGCQKALAKGAVFYDATTKEVWVSDFGVNAEVRERRRSVIAKLQTSSVQQKKAMKLVRDQNDIVFNYILAHVEEL